MSAQVHAFPTSRHSKVVEFISREMRACPSIDAAEQHLIKHLEIEWDRLADIGVDADEIERACRAFARAAWAAVSRDAEHEGAA
jgi:hypothetical protein